MWCHPESPVTSFRPSECVPPHCNALCRGMRRRFPNQWCPNHLSQVQVCTVHTSTKTVHLRSVSSPWSCSSVKNCFCYRPRAWTSSTCEDIHSRLGSSNLYCPWGPKLSVAALRQLWGSRGQRPRRRRASFQCIVEVYTYDCKRRHLGHCG